MISYLPIFKIATLQAPQDRLISKIGGVPWGLPHKHWPFCCNRPQKLLAQLRHQPPFLDLGREGAVLHLFQCLECLNLGESFCPGIILQESEMSDCPQAILGCYQEAELGRPLIGEVWIEGFETVDDGIPPNRLPDLYDRSQLWALEEEFPDIDWYDGKTRTRFGGTPRWTGNGPIYFEKPPFEFLLQLDNNFYIQGLAPDPDLAGCEISLFGDRPNMYKVQKPHPSKIKINAPWIIGCENDSEFVIEYTNLGTDGTAFAFIDRTKNPPEVRWHWNR